MDTTITVKYTKSGGGGGGGITVPTVKPSYSDVISDLPEPIEPQDVAKTAEAQAAQSGQVLVSTQTVTHEYLTLSGKVARETVKENGTVTDVMDFVYDESGRPFAMIHQAGSAGITLTIYFYILNLQGDVVKLVTSSGSAVATYEYDAWGNILSKSGTMADKNPLRYRGYYYDTETGFYYLRSRYYDPSMRRFLSTDGYASTGQGFVGMNMFAYCNNNPVTYADSAGTAADPRLNPSYMNDGYGVSPLKTSLLNYVCNSGKFDPDMSYGATNVQVSVRSSGRYKKEKEDSTLDTTVGVGGAVTTVGGKIRDIREFNAELHGKDVVQSAGHGKTIMKGIGIAVVVAGFIQFCKDYTDIVPEGDYDSFVVTITWDSNFYGFDVSKERKLIGYAATYKFIWCDAFDDNNFWSVVESGLQPIYEPLLP